MAAETAPLRWVACSQDASYAASQHRHLIRGKVHTTLCGASASFPEVWRGNSTKPECPQCLTARNSQTGTPS